MSALTDQLSEQFDANALVPPEVAADYATAKGYYDAFHSATQGMSLGKNGTVQISDANSKAALQSMIGAMQFIPVVGQAIGIALEVLMALVPSAGAGPGTCSTDPPRVADPKNPKPSELAAWPHHTSWESFHGGSYPRGAAGSFEAFANPLLEWNWELSANCFSDLYVPSPVLLGTLIASWNATHASTSTRTVTRTGLNPAGFGTAPIDDPIAEALEAAIIAKATRPGDTSFDAGAGAPHNVTSSFIVHAGAVITAPAVKLDFSNLPDYSQAGAAAAAAAKAAAASGIAARHAQTSAIIGAGVTNQRSALAAQFAAADAAAAAATRSSSTTKAVIGGLAALAAAGAFAVSRFL
jgi:hypothetical protein